MRGLRLLQCSAGSLLLACGGLVDANAVSGDHPDGEATDGEAAESGSDSGSDDASDGSSTAVQLGPASLLFHNQEEALGLASGAAVLGHAPDESSIQTYTIYWGSGIGAKLSSTPLATFVADGTDHVLLIDDKTKTPLGAGELLAYGNGAAGESAPVTASLKFVPPAYLDISAGVTSDFGAHVCAAFDSTNDRLVVVAADSTATGTRTVTCKPTGKSCVSKLSSSTDGLMPDDLVLDVASKKMVSIGVNPPSALRCDLDGSGCTVTVTDGSLQLGGADGRQLAIDSINNKLLTVGYASAGHALLIRCDLDATGCTTVDLTASAGAADGSGYWPSPVVDTKNKRLLVAVDDMAGGMGHGAKLLVCNLDGSACTQKDVSAGVIASVGAQRLLLDPVNGRLALVRTEAVSSTVYGLYLYMIPLDGSSSVRVSLGITDVEEIAPLVDVVGQRLVVGYNDDVNEPSMATCHLDGKGCRTRSLSLGLGMDSAMYVSATFDPISRMLFVATDNESGGGGERPGLVIFGL